MFLSTGLSPPPSLSLPDFLAKDGSSFSSLIMPNWAPICHVYSAGTKQRGEPRLCPLPLAPFPLPKPRLIILPPAPSKHAHETNGRLDRTGPEKYSFSFRLLTRSYLCLPFKCVTSTFHMTLFL